MRLYTFQHDGESRIGAEHDGSLVDLRTSHSARIKYLGQPELSENTFPVDMLALLRLGGQGMNLAQQALQFAVELGSGAFKFPLTEVRLLAPIPRPGKILCSGINYYSHKTENPNAVLPESPFFFSKLPSAVIGPGESIIHPKATSQLDYEVELAVVIGKSMHHTPENQVMEKIAGYTILHDVSARDVQFKDNQITLGKNFDTFAPIGPCLVTADEIPNPENLRLRSLLNGQVMQDGSTQDWVFSLPRLLSSLSHVMTLDPGDIVTTGTPSGVGVFRKPPVFLKPGDKVIVEVEKIGQLESSVVSDN